MKINACKVQNMENPIGLETENPSFSYLLEAKKQGERQTAYRILVASSRERLLQNQADLWDSNQIKSEQNAAIMYKGCRLASRQTAWWKVQVWDQDGSICQSDPAMFEMGLRKPEDWVAEWIGEGEDEKTKQHQAPAFATSFMLYNLQDIEKARLYISGLGLFVASINGQSVTENLYEPGESEYNRRVFYRTYDILSFLCEGENAIGVVLGNGQYTNYAVAPVMKYGDGSLCETHRYQKDDTAFLKDGICGRKKMLAQIEITRKNGQTEVISASDETWRMHKSPTCFQNWYGGEDFDGILYKQMEGWDCAGYDRSQWCHAKKMQPPKGVLSAREYLPIRITERWSAICVKRLPNGHYLVDFGKNSAGFVWLKLDTTEAHKGEWIRMYPGEVLREDGMGVDQASISQSCNTFYSCYVSDSYRIAGTGKEEWHPQFCYHGFQYVEVEGFSGVLSTENFDACAVRVINEKYSDFETNLDILNKINQITERSIESNMMSSFTDCPQIEKLGWLETAHLMFASMASGYDIRSWMPKIMQDAADAQVTEELLHGMGIPQQPEQFPGADYENLQGNETEGIGFVPAIAPEYFRIKGLHKDPNWGGTCILAPWYYYQEYEDRSVLDRFYPTMCLYIRYLEGVSTNGVLKGYAQMGEWGQLNENTPTTLVATCSFYLQAVTLSKIADILGKMEDKQYYEGLAKQIQEGFYQDEECVHSQGKQLIFGNGSQASYGCVLFSEIVKEKDLIHAQRQLVDAVERNDRRLNSGEVGLKQVFYALAKQERNDLVYQMVMNPQEPSYRCHVEHGLTTLPEYWNYTELWRGLGRSRNHAMMGHVKEWFSRFVLGIQMIEPGYRYVKLAPYLNEELTSVRGSVFTIHGFIRVSCSWSKILEKEYVSMQIQLPIGCCADAYLPCSSKDFLLTEGNESDYDIVEDGRIRIKNLTSGSWNFTAEKRS